MQLFDSHSHLDVAEFDADRSEVLSRARATRVTHQVVPAIGVAGFAKLRDLCRTQAGLYPAYGLHPMFLSDHRPEHLDELAMWIQRELPVAVGECGLDFYIEGLDAEAQRMYFRRQLELAREFDLPLVLHARRAVDEVIATLRSVGSLRGVVHSLSGRIEQAQQLWKMGFCVGLGGPITYPRARRLRELVATMPLEFLLLETDSPDQPLHGHQGVRNEPSRLAEVCECVAQLRGVSAEAVAKATTENARRVFRIPAN
jgi:TatD DNase family protein